jgi:phage gp29-like protein
MAEAAPQRPELGEIAPPDDPLNPLRGTGLQAAPYVSILTPEDSILRSKGGIENLRIYRELLRDDQVAAAWQQRRLSLLSCETKVEPGADDAASIAAADALREELGALAWDDVTDKALHAIFFGWGVAEVLWRPDGSRVRFDAIKVRDRARFRFDRDQRLYLWAQGWRVMPDRKFWTLRAGADHHDEPYGLGLAHALYWPVFFKRNDIKFWLVFLEKFGMPTALAKVPAGQINDPAVVSKAVAMLRQIATDAGVVVPDSVAVELLEAARGGAADYESLHAAMNSAISKILVGQTMTTDNGSSRAQAQVHERVAEAIMQADSDLLCGSFTAGPVRWWTEWNFSGATPPRVWRDTKAPEDMNRRAERDERIAKLGYDPTEDYIRATYGEGWAKRADPLQVIGQAMQAAQPGDGPAFAEGESVALAALRAARRGDQQAIVDAAQLFADQYRTVMGDRVGQLLRAAEFSDDPDTFLRRLDELLAEAPAPSTLDKLTRALASSRMLAALRTQRRRPGA